MNFSEALDKLKAGYAISRKGWNGANMFIYLEHESLVDEKKVRNDTLRKLLSANTNKVKFNSHIDMKTADGSVTVGWIASQTDILADDWILYDNKIVSINLKQ